MPHIKGLREVDRLRIAAESYRSPRTVDAVLAGRGTDLSRSAIADAAERLGINLPVHEKK